MRYAHEQHGVIHRDIKPANTLVTRDGVLKITDFGLSKLQAELAGESLTRENRTMNADDAETVTGVFVTAAGYCLGTPAYIAPEAITNPQMVDVRSDIYSFGIMLYEMLAGERPFRSAGILRQHIDSIPSPVRLLNPDISIELDRVVMRCLEKQPQARFENFAALEDALLRVAECTERIELPPQEQHEIPEFGNWFMKGFSLMTFGKFDAAADCFRQAIALAPDNHEAHNNLGVCLARLNRLDEAIVATETATTLKSDYAEAWSNLGALYEQQQRYENGIAACRRAIQIKPRWAEAHSNLGLNLARLGRTDEARASFNRAIAEDDSYWLAYLKLAELFTAEGSLNEALKLLQTANEINPREPNLLAALAACLMDLGNKEEAAKYAERALQLDGEHPVALRVSPSK
jgi:serine/threonine protein kinase